MPKPCKFLSLDSGRKRFLWTHKEVDLEVSSYTWFRKPGSFFSESASRVHVSLTFKKTEVKRDLTQLELACEAEGVASPDPV